MILENLISQLWEMMNFPPKTEWIEFKEAKTNFDSDDLGKYFSALSNEANLHGKLAGWLFFGITDRPSPTGCRFKLSPGSPLS